MDSRLAELLRQKALLQEHLAWLDREIARARTPAEEAPPAAVPSLSLSPAAAPPVPDPTSLLESDPIALKQDVRKGCFLYFGLAVALLALGILTLYWAFG